MLKTQTSILLVAIGAALAMSACGSGSNGSSSNSVAASLAPASSGATNSTAIGSTTGSTVSGSGTASSGSATSGSGTASSGTSTGANTGSGSTTPVSPPLPTAPTDYSSAKQMWTNKNLQNYQYTAQKSCYCLIDQTLPYTITVNGGKAVSIIHVEQEIINTKLDYLPTIDYVFGRIQNAITQNAAKIAVTYNPEYGFPEKTSIDISTMIADEEEYYQISNFKVLP